MLHAMLRASVTIAAAAIAQEAPKPVRVEEPPLRGTVRFAGKAVALDAGGAAHAAQDGTLWLWQEGASAFDVAVRAGRFEGWLLSEAAVRVVAVELDGRSLDVGEFGDLQFEPPFADDVTITGPWIKPIELHVVDAKSGAALTDLEWIVRRRDSGLCSHPGRISAAETVVAAGPPPLRLAHFGSWYVCAPGHAWGLFDFRRVADAPAVLELAEACALTIVAKGVDPTLPVRVRLDVPSSGDELLLVDLPPDGRLEVDSLPPEVVRVTALLDFDGKP